MLLIDARDAEGAERHWRTHMEVIGRKLLRDDMGAKAIVDLFGWRRPARLARPARLTPARPA